MPRVCELAGGGILLLGSVMPCVFEPGVLVVGAVVPVVAVQLCAKASDELAASIMVIRTIRMRASMCVQQ